MHLPAHVFAPAFRHKKLGWLFALLVGIMVYLASFATVAEATLSAVTFTWDKKMESRLTVEIPAVEDESSAPQSDRIQKILAALQAMPGIAGVTVISDDETTNLLKPWITQPELLQALPIPALIDVTRTDGVTLGAIELQTRLEKIVSGVRVDDHAAWLGDLAHLVRGLSAMAGLIVLLTTITLMTVVSLLCRAVMATEHEAITLLHVMGAEDRDIARHFQFHARSMATPASLMGFILALASGGLLLFFSRHLIDLSSLQPVHWIGLGCSVLVVPILAIMIAALAARVSVLHLLHSLP